MQETQVRSLHPENPLQKEMTTHASIPAWRISWTEEPGRLQSMGLQKAIYTTGQLTLSLHIQKSEEGWANITLNELIIHPVCPGEE